MVLYRNKYSCNKILLEYCILVSFVSDVSFKMFICFRTISQSSSEQSQDQHVKTTITGPTFKNDHQ